MAAKTASLESLDPATAWQAWKPSAADPWGSKWVAHLYGRAAFGANAKELALAQRLGPGATLDRLLAGTPERDEILPTLLDAGRVAVHDESGEALRSWWLYCMLQGGHPLREKMTLFWHNHFATSLVKVQDTALMFRQNCLLRQHALGHFGVLLHEVSRDPAMLVWLDSNTNVKGRPNENYARELMELFSLGVGHYTEKDIREAARAFTGWHTDGYAFAFNADAHDKGSKTVLGRTGHWDGDDIVNIVLDRAETARFVVRKLYQFLISESAAPPDRLLEPLCEWFRKSDYDIAGLLRTMLASRHFYSPFAFRQRIKSPVEYVLGAAQMVYGRYDESQPGYRPFPQQVLLPWLEAMGQQLFAPPNVKGWPGARAWLNTATMLQRDNFAAELALGSLWSRTPAGLVAVSAASRPVSMDWTVVDPYSGPTNTTDPPMAWDCARLVQEAGASQPEEILRVLLDRFVPGGIRPEAQAKLVAYLAAGRPTGSELQRRVREAVHAILTMPEYQLA